MSLVITYTCGATSVVVPLVITCEACQAKLQALVYDVLPSLEEGAGKRCSECDSDFERDGNAAVPYDAETDEDRHTQL